MRSLVNMPCRYEARSVPETTIRPRWERSRNAERWRAASYAGAETAGIMVLCLRDALGPFYPREARRTGDRAAGDRPAAQRVRAAAATGASAAGDRRHEFRDLPARRTDRHGADGGHAHGDRLDRVQLRPSRRADRRGRAARAGALHGRLEAAGVYARRHD